MKICDKRALFPSGQLDPIAECEVSKVFPFRGPHEISVRAELHLTTKLVCISGDLVVIGNHAKH